MITTNEINLVASKLGSITTETINQYTQWHFVDALVWTLGGVFIIIACGKTFKWCKEHGDEMIWALWAVTLCLGVLAIVCNFVNLVCPRAYAIHQLITDIH